MILESLISADNEAKEQEKMQLASMPKIVRRFQELYGKGQLSELERAWKECYEDASRMQRKVLRGYFALNGEIDLKRFYDRVVALHPSGTADLAGQILLKNAVWEAYTRGIEDSKTGYRVKMVKAKP